MATEEIKPQIKKTQHKQKQAQQVKEDLPPQILPPLPVPYKSCSLKVSIHCEGCKRKVNKILTSIEGVYKVDIDVKQHRVMVAGIVPPEILLKKLHKAGKNADLLPEIPDPVEHKPVDPNESKPVDPKEKNMNKKEKKKQEEKAEKIDGATSSGSGRPECEKTDAGDCGSGEGGETSCPVKVKKKDVLEEKDSIPVDSPAPAAEKKVGESGGAVGKKKKKKGQNLSTVHNATDAAARTQLVPPPTTSTDNDRPFNQIDGHHILTSNYPPRQDLYPYPPPNYYAPQVMYGVSYNVAQPSVSVDAASYYTPPPPYSYAYMHPGYQPSDQNPYPSRPSDSFELFSDENPNGCSIM